MSGAIEAAGDALTGTVIARAVEPPRGEASENSQHNCLNCGAALSGPYCHECGQGAHIHRTLTALGHDIAHGVFHFEGKVWHTLPLLAWRPGDLTRRYVHGERARFVSPLALFLFSVFLMFAVFESVGGPFTPNITQDGAPVRVSNLKTEIVKAKARIANLEKQRLEAVAAGKPTEVIDRKLADAQSDVGAMTAVSTMTSGVNPDDLSGAIKIDTGYRSIDDRVKDAIKNPKLLLYKLQSSAYKFSWALIPLSLPFMWAMFAWRRQYKLYDHAVFVTYSIAFVMLLLVVMALLAAVGIETSWMMFLVPVHFFRQLKQAYGLSVFSTLWRTMALIAVSSHHIVHVRPAAIGTRPQRVTAHAPCGSRVAKAAGTSRFGDRRPTTRSIAWLITILVGAIRT